jgi:hypothetical protein
MKALHSYYYYLLLALLSFVSANKSNPLWLWIISCWFCFRSYLWTKALHSYYYFILFYFYQVQAEFTFFTGCTYYEGLVQFTDEFTFVFIYFYWSLVQMWVHFLHWFADEVTFFILLFYWSLVWVRAKFTLFTGVYMLQSIFMLHWRIIIWHQYGRGAVPVWGQTQDHVCGSYAYPPRVPASTSNNLTYF